MSQGVLDYLDSPVCFQRTFLRTLAHGSRSDVVVGHHPESKQLPSSGAAPYAVTEFATRIATNLCC
ncbi:MAG: hypothetical protein AAGI88_21920, partial [Pseudomonadota bacterium]